MPWKNQACSSSQFKGFAASPLFQAVVCYGRKDYSQFFINQFTALSVGNGRISTLYSFFEDFFSFFVVNKFNPCPTLLGEACSSE